MIHGTANGVLVMLALVVMTVCANAQAVRKPVAADFLLPDAYRLKSGVDYVAGINPALLAFSGEPSAGLWGERRFLLADLTHIAAWGKVQAYGGGFALHMARFGSSNNNETGISLAYGRKLGKTIGLGAQFNYYGGVQSGYPAHKAINFDAGVVFQLSPELAAGIHIYNPFASPPWEDEVAATLPAEYSLGLGYEGSENFYFGAVASRSRAGPVTVRAMLRYLFSKGYCARAGINTAASSFSVGWSVPLAKFNIEATASAHPQLGITPGLGITWHKSEPQ
jgi:hypothetical protein